MELIGFIQVFNIIVIAIGTLLHMCCRSLTFSSSTSSSGAAAVDDNDDDDDHIPPLREKYDVFISFRGEDTRKTFTSHLHAALLRKKFETYIDYRLKIGDEIAPALLEAIEKSRLSVIIFSKNYASSTWCLIELVHILKCKKKHDQMVVPIFYDINPSDVRKQKGSYADAFAELENRFKDSMGKVRKWRKALRTAANLSGFDYSNKKGTDADFIEEVVEDISTKLKRETSYDLKGMVGIKSRIEQVESLLSINDWQGVCTVGIWGMGGIGKTTLAKAVFKRLFFNFEASCFLSNVREKSEQTDGVDQLQNTLLREILKEENLSIDSTSVRDRLSRTKLLIVFDDVSDSRQIKDLAGDNLRYGDGSRIIVTSRERSVVMRAVRDEKYIYQVEELKTNEALRLFQFHAFNDNSPRAEYRELSERVVKYAGGIPLALEILGSLFFPCENKQQWEDVLSTLRNYPNEEIQNTFRVSYNRLGRNAQEVFLDIACFYKGKPIEYVKKMVEFGQMHGGLCAADGIRVLRDRSLISIDSERETIDMHDLVQETGWAIVHQQCIEEPGRRSRLFITEDVYQVLKNNTGAEKVQAIFINMSNFQIKKKLDYADFEKMYNLRLLQVDTLNLWLKSAVWFDVGPDILTLSLPNSLRYLSWAHYPLKSLPPKFSLENLVELHMPYSQVTQLWNGGQNPMNLKVIELHYCNHLTALPNPLGSPNIERIVLSRCGHLVKIPSSFQYLDKLTYLDLTWCNSLKYLPEMPGNIECLKLTGSGIEKLPSSVWSHEKISSLDIGYCTELKKLPRSSCKLKLSGAFSLQRCHTLGKFWELPRGIDELDFSSTAIRVLPTSSMECLFCLTTLKMRYCQYLASLPPSICKLKSLEELDLTGCTGLYEFPEILEPMEHLLFLSLEGTAVKELHSSIQFLCALVNIRLKGCERLASLPPSICKLKSLQVLDPTDCTGFYEFPDIMESMEHLKFLHLEKTAVEALPQSVGNLIGLEILYLCRCTKFKVVPSSIYKLTNLKELSFYACSELQNFPQPAGSVCLLSLEELNLGYSGILEIPEYLICSSSLRDINLRGTTIRSVPSSIKQASQLSSLWLSKCKSLQSLPELPVLSRLEAADCESLKTVSSSRTAITECWNRYELLQEELNFYNCQWLGYDADARNSIMADAQLRIMRVATASSKLSLSNMTSQSMLQGKYPNPLVTIVCPGYEIPNWFVYQNEGASTNVKLPANWSRQGFLGFALSVVASQHHFQPWAKYLCKYNFKTEEGETHEINCNFPFWYNDGDGEGCSLDSKHVYVLYKDLENEEGAKWSSAFYCRATEVSVHLEPLPNQFLKVEKCGICLLYAEDAERLKFDVMSRQEQDGSAASGGGEPDASGSN